MEPEEHIEATLILQPEQTTKNPPGKGSLTFTPQLGPDGGGQVPSGDSGGPSGNSASFNATQVPSGGGQVPPAGGMVQGSLSSSLSAEQLAELGLMKPLMVTFILFRTWRMVDIGLIQLMTSR